MIDWKKMIKFTSAVIGGAMLTSCGTMQMGWDHGGLRQTMMRYTEDQIMDNVIRAKKGYPLMHFDVDSVGADVTTDLKVDAGLGETLTHKVAALANEVSRPMTFNPSASRNSKLTLTMKPVLNANEVYTAYIAFANIEGALVHDDNVNRRTVHIGRWFTGANGVREYWYVPEEREFVEPFFWLCLRTSVYRGETAKDPRVSVSSSPAMRSKVSGSASKPKISIPQELLGPSITPDILKLRRGDSLEDVVRELRNLQRN